MRELYYLNNFGQSVSFMDWPYKVSESDLFDYEWSYESRNSVNPKISRFYRELTGKSIKISVSAESEQLYSNALMRLLEVTERDVLNLSPGKLYVDGEYLSCYIYKSKKADWVPGVTFLTNTFSIVSETGSWIKETTTPFRATGSVAVLSESASKNLDYNCDYLMDYASSIIGRNLFSDGFSDMDFEITIYGGCQNPEIHIAGHTYGVDCQLETGEYLKINSVSKKVYKVEVNGTQINQFHLRNREHYIFQKIHPGNIPVTWNGTFGFDVTLMERRSEPRWT